jgi:hypothetical protein
MTPERKEQLERFFTTIDIKEKLAAVTGDDARIRILQAEVAKPGVTELQKKIIFEQTRAMLSPEGASNFDAFFDGLGKLQAWNDTKSKLVADVKAASTLEERNAIYQGVAATVTDPARTKELFGAYLDALPADQRDRVVKFIEGVTRAEQQRRADAAAATRSTRQTSGSDASDSSSSGADAAPVDGAGSVTQEQQLRSNYATAYGVWNTLKNENRQRNSTIRDLERRRDALVGGGPDAMARNSISAQIRQLKAEGDRAFPATNEALRNRNAAWEAWKPGVRPITAP